MTTLTSQHSLRLRLDDRTELRAIEAADAPALYAMVAADRDYLSWRLPIFATWTSLEVASKAIEDWLEQQEALGSLFMGLWQEGELKGLVTLEVFDRTNGFAALGFSVCKALQGTSTAFRAAHAVLAHAFGPLKFHRIIARCTVDNWRAIRLLARLGFRPEGTLRDALKVEGRFIDLFSYALLAPEWFAFEPETHKLTSAR